jgi:Trk-type K+ transport system membrane component
MNPESNGWFDIFAIIFELTSAYGTVGLSLGLPTVSALLEILSERD